MHTAWSAPADTFGKAFTTIVILELVPVHPEVVPLTFTISPLSNEDVVNTFTGEGAP